MTNVAMDRLAGWVRNSTTNVKCPPRTLEGATRVEIQAGVWREPDLAAPINCE
jgi:hypothetical protein